MAKWKVLNVVWGKYRIHHEEDGTWSVLHGGCTLFRKITSLAEAKKYAEESEQKYDDLSKAHFDNELQRQASLL